MAAHWLGVLNTNVLMVLVYVLMLPLASFIRFRDPLRKRLHGDTFWEDRKPADRSLRRHTLQF